MDHAIDLRWNQFINCFTFDRSRKVSCVHATAFCAKHCYNRMTDTWKWVNEKDKRLEESWQWFNGNNVARILSCKRSRQTDRVRFMGRGEAFRDMSDVPHVLDICSGSPNRLFWIPTRAWRDNELRTAIENRVLEVPNIRVQASTDPTTSISEYSSLVASGWSSMFFGESIDIAEDRYGVKFHKCAKTHKHIKGHCAECVGGCFDASQVHVHLEEH